jgi:outer membrane receptor for ferrienterochelin and colicins
MVFPDWGRTRSTARSLVMRALLIAVIATAAMPGRAAGQSPSRLPDLDLEDLMGVGVQNVFGASARLQPVTEAPASVTIVTADDIHRYGYRTLADILRGTRGFYIRDDRTYSYVGVRGVSRPGDYNSRVLLLVNGHKINDSIYDQAYIGAELGIDVAMFERVEIIRGPASSLYGTSAFFAVINVVTRSGASMHGASLQVDEGTLGSQLARASYGRQLANGVDMAASGTYERTLGVGRLYFPAFDASGDNHGIAENLDGEQIGELYGRLSLRDLTLTAVYGRREKDVPTAAFGTLFDSQSPRQRMTDRHTMIDGRYDRVVGGTRVAVDLAFDRLYTDGIYPHASENPAVPLLINHDSADGARWSISGHVTRALPGRQTLTAGGEFVDNVTQSQWDTYNDALVPGFTIDQPSHQSAVYLQDEIRIRPWLMVNAGVRYDRYERFAKATPRGAVIVTPSANQSFKYLFGRAFRAPNAYELYYYSDATAYLRPESIGTHELVWEQYLGEWLRTSVSAYHSTASQLITLESSEASGQFAALSFFNDGILHARGMEFETEVRAKRGLQLLGSYTLQKTEDDARTPAINSPAHMAKLRFSAPGPFERSIGSFEVQYLSARHTLADTTVAAAVVANATASIQLTRSFELLATVRNLFDQQYSDPASTEHLLDVIQQNGRTARISLRWNQGTR